MCQVCGRTGTLATHVRKDTSKDTHLPYSLCDFCLKTDGVRDMYDAAPTQVIQCKVMSLYIAEAQDRVRDAQRSLQAKQYWLNELQNWNETV